MPRRYRRRVTPPTQITIPAVCPTCRGAGELPVLDGALLTILRLNRGLSMRALGLASGTSASSICDFERGFRRPRLATLVRLRRALGVAVVVS